MKTYLKSIEFVLGQLYVFARDDDDGGGDGDPVRDDDDIPPMP